MIRWELKKLLNPVWMSVVFSLIASIWILLMYFASTSGEQRIVERFFSYWSVLGSLSLGMIILFVNTKLFSLDSEQHIKEVVLTTKHGKRRLLATRFFVTMMFTAIIVSLLMALQLAGLLLFVEPEYGMLNATYMMQIVTVFMGSELFAIFAACLCILLSSHAATVTLCAFLFGCTYIFRTNFETSIFSLNGLFDKGFFSYLVRGETLLNSEVQAFIAWYGFLMMITIILTLTFQSRRNEL